MYTSKFEACCESGAVKTLASHPPQSQKHYQEFIYPVICLVCVSTACDISGKM